MSLQLVPELQLVPIISLFHNLRLLWPFSYHLCCTCWLRLYKITLIPEGSEPLVGTHVSVWVTVLVHSQSQLSVSKWITWATHISPSLPSLYSGSCTSTCTRVSHPCLDGDFSSCLMVLDTRCSKFLGCSHILYFNGILAVSSGKNEPLLPPYTKSHSSWN